MLCYKNARTAHLIIRADCNLPNNAVIWGTKGLIEVRAFVTLFSQEKCQFMLSQTIVFKVGIWISNQMQSFDFKRIV